VEGLSDYGRAHTFIVRLLEGGVRSPPRCREFNISRKTGYKIVDRYKECGLGEYPTALGGLTGIATNCWFGSRPPS
jgi:hypothetical protein